MTNSDKIRALSDEKLAHLIAPSFIDDCFLPETIQCKRNLTCEQCILNWLKAEVEDAENKI